MASNKAPKNDFAPAWLKIPESEGSKPPGGRGIDHDKSVRAGRRDDYYNNFSRYPVAPDYSYHPLQRQRSFDYYDERRYSPQKFRHHSVDDGYYNNGYGPFPYFNGYDHYSSQPSLGKYQHPNARFGNGPGPVNGVFPPYYDPPYYDYYGEPYYSAGNYTARLSNGGKRSHVDKHNGKPHPPDKDAKNTSPVKNNLSSNKGSIEEEFPSLNGDSESPNPADKPRVNSNGVWEKPMNNKKKNINNVKLKPTDQPREPAPSKQSVAMYKALVPKQASLNRKSSKDGLKSSGSKDLPNGPSKVSPGHFKSAKEANNKSFSGREVSSPTASAPMEILNKQLVTQPKNLADKKSQFLKALKIESPKPTILTNKNNKGNSLDNAGNQECDSEGVSNGVHKLSVSGPGSDLLSSSLEAEQRLLKQMGWSETDDDHYVITEEDMKEFQNLTKQMKERKNGLNLRLPPAWSPQTLNIYQHPSLLVEDSGTSSDDDSDLDDGV